MKPEYSANQISPDSTISRFSGSVIRFLVGRVTSIRQSVSGWPWGCHTCLDAQIFSQVHLERPPPDGTVQAIHDCVSYQVNIMPQKPLVHLQFFFHVAQAGTRVAAIAHWVQLCVDLRLATFNFQLIASDDVQRLGLQFLFHPPTANSFTNKCRL